MGGLQFLDLSNVAQQRLATPLPLLTHGAGACLTVAQCGKLSAHWNMLDAVPGHEFFHKRLSYSALDVKCYQVGMVSKRHKALI